MKKYLTGLLSLLLVATTSLPIGCNGNIGTQPVYTTTVPQPGNPQSFKINIYNGTQYPLHIGSIFGGPTTVIPIGTWAEYYVNFLPYSISIDAYLPTVPPYVFPTRTLFYNVDYSPYATSVGVSYY
jgi:hypothetical protein